MILVPFPARRRAHQPSQLGSLQRYLDAEKAMSLLNRLLAEEGGGMTIYSPEPKQEIVISAWWTDWRCKTFTGNTLLECLVAAAGEMEAKKENSHAHH